MIAAKQQQGGRTDRQAEHTHSNEDLNQWEFQGFGARAMPERRKNCQQLNRAASLLLKNKHHPHLLQSRTLTP